MIRDDNNFRNKEELVVYPSGMFTFGIESKNGGGNILVQRMMHDTISVSVNNTSTSMGIELTPEQARKLAMVLGRAADVMDAEK